MNILALDSADKVLSVALQANSDIWYTEIDAGTRHSELMMECIDDLFKKTGISQKELNLAACMQGPGSFTGLRIGFSTVKGLALALGIPFSAIPTLDCLAYPFSSWPGIVVPAIDAKKNCFFTAFYRDGKKLTEYMDESPQTIARELEKVRLSGTEPVIVTGYGANLLCPLLSGFFPSDYISLDPIFGRGKARELLEIIKRDIIRVNTGMDIGPEYLRKSDAEIKLK